MAKTDSFLFDSFARLNVHFVRGKGVWLYTEKNEAYLDLTGGVAVNAFGHSHPYLNKVLMEQAEKLWHLSNLFPVEGQEKLAKKLCDHSFAEKVFFINCGAEAIETAIKITRRYFYSLNTEKKHNILTFEGAFHGRTLAALAATNQPKYLEGFEPKAPGFQQIPFGDLTKVEAAINENTAAILIEPIQAEAGVRVVPKNFLQGLQALCDKYQLLLILDEVQTGIGRTGKFFAYEWSDITPDILCAAKGIGGGFPLGACLTTAKIAQYMTVGTHGTTFGGNPLAMAVGEAVLDLLFQPNFLNHVYDMGVLFKQELLQLITKYNSILKGYQGQGLLIGLECHIPNKEIVKACLEQKLLLVTAGRNMLRLLPSLILTAEEIHEAIRRFEAALKNLQS